MATKWHPASGKWGIFGETSGSKQAKRALSQIDEMLLDLEGRRENITGYYQGLGFLEDEKSENEMLTTLESFLDKSYNFKTESEEMAGKTNLATVVNKESIMTEDKINRDRDSFLKNYQYETNLRELNLGQKEQTDLFNLDDLIRNLQLQREDYT